MVISVIVIEPATASEIRLYLQRLFGDFGEDFLASIKEYECSFYYQKKKKKMVMNRSLKAKCVAVGKIIKRQGI